MHPTDLCPKCGEEVGSAIHYVGQCPVYSMIRMRCWGTAVVSYDMLRTDETLAPLILYLKETKRLTEWTYHSTRELPPR